MSRFRRLSYLVPILSVGLLVWLIDMNQFFGTLSRADPFWYMAGMGLFVLSYVPLTLRWQRLLRGVGYRGGLLNAFEVIAISYGLNKLLPANAGDVSRSATSEMYYEVDEHSEILGLVLFERFMDVLVIGVLVVTATVLLPKQPGRAVVIGGAVVFFLILSLSIGIFPATRAAALSVIPDRVERIVDNVLFTYARLSLSTVLAVVSLSLVRWLMAIGLMLPLAAAVDLAVTLPLAALVVGTMSLATVLPLSPGGVGPVEAVGVGVLVLFGFGSEAAFSLVLLQRSLGLVLTTLIGLAVYTCRVGDWM